MRSVESGNRVGTGVRVCGAKWSGGKEGKEESRTGSSSKKPRDRRGRQAGGLWGTEKAGATRPHQLALSQGHEAQRRVHVTQADAAVHLLGSGLHRRLRYT